MTMLLVDVASYQGDLEPADVKAAGFDAVNLKISHGLGQKSVHPYVAGWMLKSKALGLGICTFHYLTADANGADQAEYAYRRIVELGLTIGTAHQLDVESDPAPTLGQVRDYLARMTDLLQRPVALYTGDWWWTARPGWDVSDLTPHLWSAPNRGYLGAYPGDVSLHWQAGYGGWPDLAVMQYAVAPMTINGKSGTIQVSKSAIRDPAVWRELTTGRPGMSYPPTTLQAARRFYIDTLARAGFTIDPLTVGIMGDDSHGKTGTSYHLGKDALKATAYSIVESPRDRAGLSDAAMALDLGKFSITVGGKAHNLRTFSVWLVAQCKAGTADTLDIREVIYSADGETVKRWDRLGVRTTGDSSHTQHTHESWFRDSETRDKTAHLRRYFTEIGVLDPPEDDMPLTSAELDSIAERVWARKLGDGGSAGGQLLTMFGRSAELRTALIPSVISAVAAAKLDTAALATAVAAAVVAALPPGNAPASVDTLASALDKVLKARFADAGPAFLAAMRSSELVGTDSTGGAAEGRQADAG